MAYQVHVYDILFELQRYQIVTQQIACPVLWSVQDFQVTDLPSHQKRQSTNIFSMAALGKKESLEKKLRQTSDIVLANTHDKKEGEERAEREIITKLITPETYYIGAVMRLNRALCYKLILRAWSN